MRLNTSDSVLLLLVSCVEARDLCPREDACFAVVAGRAAHGQDDLRRAHCSSYLATTVIPSASPPTMSSHLVRRRGRANAVCPNDKPDYASVCDDAAYQSACSAWGITAETIVTATSSPTTSANNSINTNDAVLCQSMHTVTVTATASNGGPSQRACLDDKEAQTFVDGFKDLLEFTSYNGTQGPPGHGYHLNVSNAILAPDFKDWSDSINWMTGFPLGNVTFASKAAFDYGQGVLQPELRVTTLNIWHNCNSITWRWSARTALNATVTGINVMVLTEDLTRIKTSYAEFDNAAWLSSFGLQCKVQR